MGDKALQGNAAEKTGRRARGESWVGEAEQGVVNELPTDLSSPKSSLVRH